MPSRSEDPSRSTSVPRRPVPSVLPELPAKPAAYSRPMGPRPPPAPRSAGSSPSSVKSRKSTSSRTMSARRVPVPSYSSPSNAASEWGEAASMVSHIRSESVSSDQFWTTRGDTSPGSFYNEDIPVSPGLQSRFETYLPFDLPSSPSPASPVSTKPHSQHSWSPEKGYFQDPKMPSLPYPAGPGDSAVNLAAQLPTLPTLASSTTTAYPPDSTLGSESSLGLQSAFPDSPRLDQHTKKSRGLSKYPSILRPEHNSHLLPAGDRRLIQPLDLPEIPPMLAVRPLFSAEQLTIADFELCHEIWSLSQLARWLHVLVSTIDADFSIQAAKLAFAKLFKFAVPTLTWVISESFAAQVVASLRDQSFILPPITSSDTQRDLLLDISAIVSGVFTLLCGKGCYARIHSSTMRCYSPRCMRETTVKPIESGRPSELRTFSGNIPGPTGPKGPMEMDWTVFWDLSPPDVADMDRQAVKRQYAVHELITSEALYVNDLQIYIDVYGQLEDVVPSVMMNQKEFCDQVFGRIRNVLATNEVLLSQMRFRQSQQGPHVEELADLVLEWVRYATPVYGAYADDYLLSDYHLRQELASSAALADWMSETGKNPKLRGVPHSFYFSRVIPRLARYGLLLGAIIKLTPEFSPDFLPLQDALTAVNALAKDCDERIARVQRRVDVQNLKVHIVFKDESLTTDLKLGDRRRKLIKRGNVLRRSGHKMEWLPTQILLLDNYFILAKNREGANGTAYYITKRPIPLELLVIESASEDPVQKVSSRLTFTTTEKPRVKKDTESSKSGPTDSVTTLEQPKDLMYPIRITHLGRAGASYTLYTSSEIEREIWRDALVEAKRALNASAFAKNSEPFRLRVLSDSFGYPANEYPMLPIQVPASAIDRAAGQEAPVYITARSRVNCVAMFGPSLYFAGMDFGIWLLADWKKRVWMKCLDLPKVTNIRVVEELNLLLVLSNGVLLWYRMDEVLDRGLTGKYEKTNPITGRRLNRQLKISDFSVAYLKDRLLILYRQQEAAGATKILKFMEPVRSRGTVPARSPVAAALRVLGTRNMSMVVDHFREVDKYVSSNEMSGFTSFHHSLITHTNRGFEYINLETKRVNVIPVDLPSFVSSSSANTNAITSAVSAAISNIATGNSGYGHALAVFRVSARLMLLCYENACCLCDNSGNLANIPVTEYVAHAQSVSYSAPYLIIVSPNMIEIRKLEIIADRVAPEPARVRQIITGKDIRLLGDIEGQVRIAMAHPTSNERQIVFELVANEYVMFDDKTSLATL